MSNAGEGISDINLKLCFLYFCDELYNTSLYSQFSTLFKMVVTQKSAKDMEYKDPFCLFCKMHWESSTSKVSKARNDSWIY